MMDDDDMDMDEDPAGGQLAYTMVALVSALSWAGDAFRYRDLFNDDYYNDDVTNGKYWRLGQQIIHFSAIGFWSTVTITQLLTYLGMAAELNMAAWWYGSMITGLAYMIGSIMVWWVYDSNYDSSDAADLAAAATIRAQSTEQAIGIIGAELELVMQYENWMD